MYDTTFETELKARTYQHKISMLMAYLAKLYIKEQSKGDIKIPLFQLQEQAVEVANKTAQSLILKGKFEESYNEAWEYLKNIIPDNYGTLL